MGEYFWISLIILSQILTGRTVLILEISLNQLQNPALCSKCLFRRIGIHNQDFTFDEYIMIKLNQKKLQCLLKFI